jgi:hypothetical protein
LPSIEEIRPILDFWQNFENWKISKIVDKNLENFFLNGLMGAFE